MAMLGGLALVIMMGDFYEFLPVVGKSLWDKAIISEKNHDKRI